MRLKVFSLIVLMCFFCVNYAAAFIVQPLDLTMSRSAWHQEATDSDEAKGQDEADSSEALKDDVTDTADYGKNVEDEVE